MTETQVFVCSICGQESTDICVSCTKDCCENHRCLKCFAAAIAVFARSRARQLSLQQPLTRAYTALGTRTDSSLFAAVLLVNRSAFASHSRYDFVLSAMFAISGPLVDRWPVSASQFVFDAALHAIEEVAGMEGCVEAAFAALRLDRRFLRGPYDFSVLRSSGVRAGTSRR